MAMKLKLLVMVLLFLVCSSVSFSQKKIPEYKYSTERGFNANDDFLSIYSNTSHVRFLGGYSHLSLLNKNFSSRISNNELKPIPGYSLGIEAFYKYLKVGINYTKNGFKIEDSRTKLKNIEATINFQGVESKLDFMLVPQIRRFAFYLGGGYSYQWIEYKEGEESRNKAENKNVGEIFWNVGFDIFLSKKVILFAEYVQSVDNKSINAFSRINAGIAYSPFSK